MAYKLTLFQNYGHIRCPHKFKPWLGSPKVHSRLRYITCFNHIRYWSCSWGYVTDQIYNPPKYNQEPPTADTYLKTADKVMILCSNLRVPLVHNLTSFAGQRTVRFMMSFQSREPPPRTGAFRRHHRSSSFDWLPAWQWPEGGLSRRHKFLFREREWCEDGTEKIEFGTRRAVWD